MACDGLWKSFSSQEAVEFVIKKVEELKVIISFHFVLVSYKENWILNFRLYQNQPIRTVWMTHDILYGRKLLIS